LESEARLLEVEKKLRSENIFPRRYFFPSLDTLGYLKNPGACAVSRDVAGRVLCLPLYPGLRERDISRITELIRSMV
jgi:dTDP-4-amino-4,6-dideoxygalactose transaminase